MNDPPGRWAVRWGVSLLALVGALVSDPILAAEWQTTRVNWRITGRAKITAVKLIAPLDSPPIGGFTPLLVSVITDKWSGDDLDWLAQLEPTLAGTALSGNPENNYAIGVLDTGAVTHLVNACDAHVLGLTADYLTGNVILISGVVGMAEALVSQPIGTFVDGLNAIQPDKTLDTTNLVGHSNVAVLVEDPGVVINPADCAGQGDLPTVIGTIFSAYYTTVILNDMPVGLLLEGKIYKSPTLKFFPPNHPEIPMYPNEITLQTRPPPADASYFGLPDLGGSLEFEPFTPTTLSLLGAGPGSLFFAGVSLSHGGLEASARLFMLDTGAQVTTVSEFVAGLLGLPAEPDFTVEIEGIGGTLPDVPGYVVDQLSIAATGGPLTFTNVPVVKLNVDSPEGGTLDGILGMNLFTDRNLVLAGDLSVPKLYLSEVLDLPVPADLDRDGDVDGFDFVTFSVCFNHSSNPPRPECANVQADLDEDGDVDGFDFVTFSICFNGSGLPPLCQ